jgi:DME family drug/metabolite transporter
MAIAGYRSLFALPVLLLAVGLDLPEVARALLRRPAVWMAAFAYAWTVTLFVLANRMTLSANAILLQYTGPLWVVVLSGPLLGERVRPRDLVAVVVGLAGLILVSLEGLAAGRWRGDLLAILSGIGFGGIPLLLRLEQHDEGPFTRQAPAFSFALGSIMTVLVTAPWMVRQGPANAGTWAVLVGLGVVQIGAAYSLFGAGTRDLRAVEASLVTMAEPVLNPIWVAIVTREIPGPGAILGGLAILVAVLLQLLG